MRTLLLRRALVPFLLLMGAAQPLVAGKKLSKADRRWLEQDVVALITEEERSLFKGLESDEEREIFKEIFWARRDPTPFDPINEFQRSFEARLRIADRSLRSLGRAGGATDMGIVFLLLGSPAEFGADVEQETRDSADELERRREAGGMEDPVRGFEEEFPAADRGEREPAVQTWTYAANERRGIPQGLTVRFREQSSFGYRLVRSPGVDDALERARRSYIVNPDIAYVRDGAGRLLPPR